MSRKVVTAIDGKGLCIDDLVKVDRVHRSVYLDPEIFALEMEKIFGTVWIYVGHESELANAGDYRTTYLGLNPVIVSRDEYGEINVLLNRCPHRAATVCQEERGSANYFRCAYHGWTFRNTGELIGATYRDGYDAAFVPEEYGLAKVPRVATYRGLIFASMNRGGPSLLDYLGLAKEYIDLIFDSAPDGAIELNSGVHRYSYDGNWKLQVENGVDAYHGHFTHETYFRAVPAMKLANVANAKSVGVSVDLGNGHALLDNRPDLEGLDALLAELTPEYGEYKARVVERVGAERAKRVLTGGSEGLFLLVFPNLLFISNQIRVVRPVRVDHTQVDLYPTRLAGAPDAINLARLRAHESFYGPAGGGAPDDLEMFRRVQRGLSAGSEEWILFLRGTHRERVEADGRRVGHVTDETPQRAIYRGWKTLLTR